MKKFAPLIAGVVMLLVATLLGAVTTAPANATGGGDNEQVCKGLDSGKIDVNGEQKTVTVTAPEGQLIDGYCVKAGSAKQDDGPEYFPVEPPAKTVTFGHSSGKGVSHYSVSYTTVPHDECPDMPGNQPPGTDCDPEEDACPDMPGHQPPGTDCDEEDDACPDMPGHQPPGTDCDEEEDACPDMPGHQPPGTDCDEPSDECDNLPGTQPEGFQCEPLTQDDYKAVTGDPNCKRDIVVTVYQKRTRTQEFVNGAWVWGAWSEWQIVDTDTRDATDEECPPNEPPPCNGPCEMPIMDNSKGDLTCRGTVKGGVYDHVRIPRGANCVLIGAYVNKSVESRGAKNVELRSTPVRGDIRLTNIKQDVYVGSKQTCRYDPYIGGSLFVRNSHNVLLCMLTVCEKVVIDHNDGRITFRDSKTRGLKVVNNNKFRYQGDSDHVLLSVIRIIDVKFKNKVVRNNDPRQVKFLHR